MSEFGLVVHCWHDPEDECYICLIAFYGEAPPGEILEQRPYILQYVSAGLVILNEKFEEIPEPLTSA